MNEQWLVQIGQLWHRISNRDGRATECGRIYEAHAPVEHRELCVDDVVCPRCYQVVPVGTLHQADPANRDWVRNACRPSERCADIPFVVTYGQRFSATASPVSASIAIAYRQRATPAERATPTRGM